MPYPSVDLLAAAADDLKDRHPLAVITIPALLRNANESGTASTELQKFGSTKENIILDSFKVHTRPKPYLAVWGKVPQLVNYDYAGSTLQRLRTLDPIGRSILRDDYSPEKQRRTKFALVPDAGSQLLQAGYQPVNKASLAAWLGRNLEFEDLEALVTWFDEIHPTQGTDLENFFMSELSTALTSVADPLAAAPASEATILERFGIHVDGPVDATNLSDNVNIPKDHQEAEGLTWTAEVCSYPLPNADVTAISNRVLEYLHQRHIGLPDAERLVHRCVVALLVGHLVLQGPPGTGKTSLARALAIGFQSQLIETTATSDWSPFHVVGGLRPNAEGGLSSAHGKFTEAALQCARTVREAVNIDEIEADEHLGLDITPQLRPQSTWLFIDEFNRADIDKAIGSLYTVLSSCDPSHLAETPIDLWFESDPASRQLWIPARFRLIAAMNDLDTSFVNTISQGLTRRFQFVTVSVPTDRGTESEPVTQEIENAFASAYDWLNRTYGPTLSIAPRDDVRADLTYCLHTLQQVIDGLRQPGSGSGWPVGTAQIVDVLRVVLLRAITHTAATDLRNVLDEAMADRLVPQMAGINDDQFEAFSTIWETAELPASASALLHLITPHEVI